MLELDLLYACRECGNFDKFLKKIPDGCTEDLYVHLNGPGGYVFEMMMYLDFFDRYKGNVTLVCEFEVNSADSLLFLLSNTRKKLSPGASCMLHLGYYTLSSIEYTSSAHNNEVWRKRNQIGDEYLDSKLKLILAKEDFDFYETGEDLVLSGEKLRLVTARAEKIFWKKKK